jgi:hypothetical protein
MTNVNLLIHEGHNFDEWLNQMLKTDFLKEQNKTRQLMYKSDASIIALYSD